jgi:hypothetical protein
MKRRYLLQGVGTTIGALGLSQFGIDRFCIQAQQYDRVLAQGKPGRKLALLIGINGYSDAIGQLYGCLNDVELQWELLVHRYGFHPDDIRVLSDQKPSCIDYTPLQPTRKNIIQTYEQHLIAQATADSTIVFFYSGHGGRVLDPYPLPTLTSVSLSGTLVAEPNVFKTQGALVTIDSEGANQYLSARSLFLLTATLAQKTQNITTCLDSCYSGGSFRGGFGGGLRRIKVARQAIKAGSSDKFNSTYPQLSEIERDDQARWMKNLDLTEEQFQVRRLQGIPAGIAIGSSQHNQISADVPFDDGKFNAGAMNYVLTRYLWQQPLNDSIRTVFGNIARRTEALSAQVLNPSQTPIAVAHREIDRDRPVYLTETTLPNADAVLRSVQGDQCHYWLGGLAVTSLEGGLEGAVFDLINAKGEPIGQIQHQARQGFLGSGTWMTGDRSAFQRGGLLREKIRSLQSDTHLRLGLDPSLKTEIPKAKFLLRSIPRLAIVENDASLDGRLVRITTELQQQLMQVAPTLTIGKIGLLNAGDTPILGSFGTADETVEGAIARLAKTFKSLLAAKMLRSMGGIDLATGKSGRGITVNVSLAAGKTGKQLGPSQFTPQSKIAIEVKNQGSEDLYVGVVTIGASGNLRVLFPYVDDFDSAEERALISPGSSLNLPDADWEFPLSKTPGTLELMVFASPTPIKSALKGLQSIARGQRGGTTSRSAGLTPQPLSGDDALGTIGSLLGDVSRTSRSIMNTTRTIAVNQFEVVSTLIEVKAE